MITLTRLDGRELVVNVDHILTAEPTPDTVLLLSTGLKLMVRESIPEILDRAAAWQRRVGVCPLHGRDLERLGIAPARPPTRPDHGGTVLAFPRGVPPEE